MGDIMADSIMLIVKPDFDIGVFSNNLAGLYQSKGYMVNVAYMNGCSIINFEKGTGGINTILGMGEGIKATCMLMNGVLSINFSDAEWTGKIVGFCIGWFLCFIPIITALIGTMSQLDLPKKIANDAMMIVMNM